MIYKLISVSVSFLSHLSQSLKTFRSSWVIRDFEHSGRMPWSRGYDEWKWKFLSQIMNDPSLRESFKEGTDLPRCYGQAMDERVIEYPWFFTHVDDGEGKHLDAGSTLNFKPCIDHKKMRNKTVIIANLNPEERCFWKEKVSYVFCDIRELPFHDSYFDSISCISTLEHVGFDNTRHYSSNPEHAEQSPNDYVKAVHEMNRVLKPGGVLYITVPFGAYQRFPHFQQFNEEMTHKIESNFSGSSSKIAYYKYMPEGWKLSNKEECREVQYFNIHDTKYYNPKSAKGYDDDRAAAARAIACIILKK